MSDSLRHSPLDAEHRALDARMTEFGGWDMPIQYRSVLEEHRACREHAVVFDVSHLGSVRVAGPGAVPVLQWALTNDLGRIGPGRAQYTHLLDPDDAHVVDDIIVWWVDDDELLVMPNASNTDPIVSTLEAAAAARDDGVLGRGHHRDAGRPRGPGPGGARPPGDVGRPRWRRSRASRSRQVAWGDVPCFVAGTGYTGEDGVEIHVPAASAPALWREIVAAGVVPAGLGARDTLRLEAGLPLHGHELGPGITPLQAGLGWVVRFDKGDFRGREPLLAEREHGVDAAAAGAAGRRAPPAARGLPGRHRRSQGRRGHERQLLADARAGHRARRSCRRTSPTGPRSRSRCGGAQCRPRS